LKGLYYFAKRIYHFSQSSPVFNRLYGKIINVWEFPLSYLYFSLKYGPKYTKIMKNSLKGLDDYAKGLILCHSADDTVPEGNNYKRVFVYHGTSDKLFTMPDKKLNADWFEYYFISGPKDLYKLKKYAHNSDEIEGKVVKIGMFRSDTIFTGNYDENKILDKYKIDPDNKKIILYAPTWIWGGGTLAQCFDKFARNITKEYILIIRPHANDRRNIKYICNWQKQNRLKNLYIFHKQYHDIMDFIHVADLMIGDNSAVNYEFALTKRPMVMVKAGCKDIFIPPDEYNIKLCAPIYDPEKDNIMQKIEEAFSDSRYDLVKRSFYFNDGHAVDRACSFIIDKLDEMKLVKKEESLQKYKNSFTYIDNYKYSLV